MHTNSPSPIKSTSKRDGLTHKNADTNHNQLNRTHKIKRVNYVEDTPINRNNKQPSTIKVEQTSSRYEESVYFIN